MKKFICTVVGIILVFMIFFTIMARSKEDYGFEKVTTYEDFIEYTNDLKVMIYNISASGLKEYEDSALKYLESQEGETSIFVVKTGTEFKYYPGGFVQNAQIEEVIQGDAGLRGKEITLYRRKGLSIYSDMEEPVYVYTLPGVNVMKPGNRYLVHCEEAEISYALSKPFYRIAISPYAVLNIDRDDEHAISDSETIITKVEGLEDEDVVAPYRNWTDQEFMGDSDESLAVFLSVKEELLKKYGLR